jgi:hypothetical protein
MYLRIQATASRFEPLPLFGRSISITISVAEGRRINGKPKQFHLGYLGYVGVPCTSAEAEVGDSFWRDLRERMEGLGISDEKQREFIAQIENLLEAVAAAKRDPETLMRLQVNPNKVLSELRLRLRQPVYLYRQA